MEDLTKNILNFLNNEHTKVEIKEDFKGNYYSYINDTIYLAKNFEQQKMPSKAKTINKDVAELIVTCHECIHSIQNKYLHILNTIFSNLSIICTLLCVAIRILGVSFLWLKIVAMSVILISIVLRLFLEIDAISGSLNLAKDMVLNRSVQEISNQDIQQATIYIKKYKGLALLQMIADKITFLILTLLIK